MSRGKQAFSARGQIRAHHPNMPPAQLRRVAFMLSYRKLEVTAENIAAMLSADNQRRTQPHRVSGLPAGRQSCEGDACRSEPSKSALWGARPEQSPQVTCPARITVPLSTCIDDYTSAASGFRGGPPECARCVIGRRRRAELAGSVLLGGAP
jgi:hypothetical protein